MEITKLFSAQSSAFISKDALFTSYLEKNLEWITDKQILSHKCVNIGKSLLELLRGDKSFASSFSFSSDINFVRVIDEISFLFRKAHLCPTPGSSATSSTPIHDFFCKILTSLDNEGELNPMCTKYQFEGGSRKGRVE